MMIDAEKLITAERLGIDASRVGQRASKNPYEDESHEAYFWLSGWCYWEAHKSVSEASDVMSVAATGIGTIQELLRSYEPKDVPVLEIVEKLESLKKRLNDYIG